MTMTKSCLEALTYRLGVAAPSEWGRVLHSHIRKGILRHHNLGFYDFLF